MEKIIVTLWITFGIYLIVLLTIMADLWSGARKAKENGLFRFCRVMKEKKSYNWIG